MRWILLAPIAALVAVVSVTTAVAGGRTTASDLATAKAAAARFQSVSAALAAGYAAPPDTPRSCIATPLGGMGYHYEHPGLMESDAIDIREPEELVYLKTADGRLQLAALEYYKRDADQNVRTQDDRPTLFGRAFDGPMPAHHPGMAVHYDLHVWLWKTNPRGTFDPWNPDVRCPALAAATAKRTTIRFRTTPDSSNRERGTFSVTGVVSDKGSVLGVVHKTEPSLDVTRTLTGAKGKLVLSVKGEFKGAYVKFAWRVVRGTGAYSRLSGSGTGTGYQAANGSHVDVFTGTLQAKTA